MYLYLGFLGGGGVKSCMFLLSYFNAVHGVGFDVAICYCCVSHFDFYFYFKAEHKILSK